MEKRLEKMDEGIAEVYHIYGCEFGDIESFRRAYYLSTHGISGVRSKFHPVGGLIMYDDPSSNEEEGEGEESTLGEVPLSADDVFVDSEPYPMASAMRRGSHCSANTSADRYSLNTSSERESPPPSASAVSKTAHYKLRMSTTTPSTSSAATTPPLSPLVQQQQQQAASPGPRELTPPAVEHSLFKRGSKRGSRRSSKKKGKKKQRAKTKVCSAGDLPQHELSPPPGEGQGQAGRSRRPSLLLETLKIGRRKSKSSQGESYDV